MLELVVYKSTSGFMQNQSYCETLNQLVCLMQAAVPHLSEDSSIVFISSIAGYNPSTNLAMYGVTKTALLGLTKV